MTHCNDINTMMCNRRQEEACTSSTRRRRRIRPSVLSFGSLLALICAARNVSAFVSAPLTLGSSNTRTPLSPYEQQQQQLPSVRPLQMAQSSTEIKKTAKKSASSATTSSYQRLSKDEERDLIDQVVEYRRLQNLEKEMALASPSKTLPLLSIRAKAAGYGQDLTEYQDALDNGHRAREELLTHNMRLVHYCVNDILKNRKKLNSLSRDDLVQEGAIGLARAIDKYNPAAGAKLSTYAVYWIRAAVLRCIAERDDLLRVPTHVSEAVRKVTKAANKLGLELDGDSIISNLSSDNKNWKEAHAAKALAVEAGLTEQQLQQAMLVKARRNTGGYTSLEPWMQNKNSLLENNNMLSSPDVEQLQQILSRYLRPKEMEALSWRYGLLQKKAKTEPKPRKFRDYLAETEEELYGSTKTTKIPTKGKWGEAMSFVEVGKQMSISAEYGRKLCHTALHKLRAAAQEGTLEPALLI